MKLLVGTVANALGDSQSLLSRAIHAALRVDLPAPADSPTGIFAQAIERSHQAAVEQGLDDRDDLPSQDDLPPRGDLPPHGTADDSPARTAAS